MAKTFYISLTVLLLLTGCTQKVGEYFSLGSNETYCEENGCDYSDAGVCDTPFNIIQNKAEARKMAYVNIECNKKLKN